MACAKTLKYLVGFTEPEEKDEVLTSTCISRVHQKTTMTTGDFTKLGSILTGKTNDPENFAEIRSQICCQ